MLLDTCKALPCRCCCCGDDEDGAGVSEAVAGGDEDAREGRSGAPLVPASSKSLERAASMLSNSCFTVLCSQGWSLKYSIFKNFKRVLLNSAAVHMS